MVNCGTIDISGDDPLTVGVDPGQISPVIEASNARMRRRSRDELQMRDAEIRAALLAKLQSEHADSETLIIEEMGLFHGRARVDVAVVNGSLAGYEIKSDCDTLKRLAGQAAIYGLCLETMTIVVGARHLAKARALIPRWWGILEVRSLSDGVKFIVRRNPKRNGRFSSEVIVRLLWKDEALSIVRQLGLKVDSDEITRRELWREIVRRSSRKAILNAVRESIKARGDWRSDPTLLRYGDSSQSPAMLQKNRRRQSNWPFDEFVHLPN